MPEPLFQQAFDEIAHDVADLAQEEHAERWHVLQRLRHPDRVIRFTVRWIDDRANVRQNTAWRIQHSNALGPYKGGLRFDPDLNEDTLRFLAFEQCFKNALTGLPLGGAKGGADLNPKACSDTEIMRFCHAFMDEFHRHGGPDTDVPAGDIGVGAREIGYLAARRTKLTTNVNGALTGKPLPLGGIAGRDEATGFGAIHFARLMLRRQNKSLDAATVAISGSGNVALHAAQRAVSLGATVLTLSDRHGALYLPNGFTQDDIEKIADAKHRGISLGSLTTIASNAEFRKDANPWSVPADIAIPCATQNELNADDAKALVKSGVALVVEGANMPCTAGACDLFENNAIPRAPGKAANAGGVAVSGLEMSQNATRIPWSREQTLERLDDIIEHIHDACVEHGQHDGHVNYTRGANRAAFTRLAEAIIAAGVN